MGKTMRRDYLLRKVQRGELEGRCTQSLTDDYAWDAATNFGKTDWLPINVIENVKDRKEGHLNIFSLEFRGSCGRAYRNDDGTITLYFPGTYYEMREKEA